MPPSRTIIGIGEALFDVFPDQSRLGGAPLNVAVHAHQLGNQGVVASRVGQDALGEQVRRELLDRGMTTNHLQFDPDRPTGTVVVAFDAHGEPQYDIIRDVAWDALQWDHDLDRLAHRADAVCYGTLAARDGQTRHTLYRFLELSRKAVRLFDVNLRQQYYTRRILTRGLELATAVKLNTSELQRLGAIFGLGEKPDHAAQALLRQFELDWLVLTRGKDGNVLFTRERKVDATPVPVAEREGGGTPVGAGDAAAAALLHGAVRGWEWERTLELANALGAYVAARPGACPPLSDELRELAK